MTSLMYVDKLETLRRFKDLKKWETFKAWDLNDLEVFSEARKAWDIALAEYESYAIDILPDLTAFIIRLFNKEIQLPSSF